MATVIPYSVLYTQHCFLQKSQSILRRENLLILRSLSLKHFPTSAELDFVLNVNQKSALKWAENA